jgi:hypothetical protein
MSFCFCKRTQAHHSGKSGKSEQAAHFLNNSESGLFNDTALLRKSKSPSPLAVANIGEARCDVDAVQGGGRSACLNIESASVSRFLKP